MRPVQIFTMITGFVFLFLGLSGFLPNTLHVTPVGAPEMIIEAYYGYLFGIFPVNALHSVIHLAIGVWGVLAYRQSGAAQIFAQQLAVMYGVLAVMGLLPGFRTVFGLIPIWGLDVWLHAGTATFAAYFGFAERSAVQVVQKPAR